MANRSIAHRVEQLELTVSGLAALPSQIADLAGRVSAVESQIVQLRTEMRGEYSAVRGEVAGVRGDIEGIRGDIADIRGDMADIRGDIADIRGDIADIRGAGFAGLRREMQEGFVAVTTELTQQILAAKSESRAMFEEVLSRIATIGEGRKRRR